MSVQHVSLEGDPDAIAAQLLQSELPPKFLDEISVDDDAGLAELLVRLTQRMGRASIEKDELIRFVERNRRALESRVSAMLNDVVEAARATDEKFGGYMDYFAENVRLALARQTDKMDMRSDKLFWLVYALGLQLKHGSISYADARAKLSRGEVVDRISRHQLVYMLYDYANAVESPQEAPTTMLMLIAECALLKRDPSALRAATKILCGYRSRTLVDETLGLLNRSVAFLNPVSGEAAELQQEIARLEAMRQRVPDHDL